MANHKVKDLGLSPVLNYEYPRVARASLTVQWVKNPLAVQEIREMWVRSLDQEDPLEWKMAIHLSILAWEIPWTEEGCSGLVGCSPWGHKESDWAQTHARADARTCAHTHIHTHTLEWLRSDMLETEFLVYVTWKFQVILKRHRSIHLSASESKMLAPRHFGWKSYPWKGNTITNSIPCHFSNGNEEVKLHMLSRLWNLALLLFWPFHYSLFWLTGHCQPLLQVGCVLRAGRQESPANQHTNYREGEKQLPFPVATPRARTSTYTETGSTLEMSCTINVLSSSEK